MRINRIAIISVLMLPTAALALTSDKNMPVFVEADNVSIDDTNEVSTYTGNVRYRQGTIQIEAQEVVIHTRNRQLKSVHASGAPVSFRQRPDNSEIDVLGSAKNIQFSASDRQVVFTGDAQFHQGENQFAGARMEYDLKSNIVRASGDQKSKERVRVVIQPEALPLKRE